MNSRTIAATLVAVACIGAAAFFLIDGRAFTSSGIPGGSKSASEQSTRREPLATRTSDKSPSPQRDGGSEHLPSKAPWSAFHERYKKGDFVWLVSNARAAPQAGSYSYAIKALNECATIASMGTQSAQRQRIESSVSEGSLRVAKLKALDELYAPCRAFTDAEALKQQRAKLSQELPQAGDAQAMMLTEAHTRLRDTNIPKDERQRRLGELLGMDDPEVASALKAVLTADGATFEGVRLSPSDRGPFSVAWEMAMCSTFGECVGRDSRRSHSDCLLHSECQYLDTFDRVTQYTPPAFAQQIHQYYSRIQSNLASRSYSAFGVP